ncbi:MAG: hypothetical protein HKN79_01740, partial [Flavobacteriales bacterium]|nr:hypothetical protein [Flavobacteriales bacterium]
QNFMDAGQYRDAYREYLSIINRDAAYKDCPERMAVAREMGTFVVAIMPIEGNIRSRNLKTKLEAYTLNSLTGLQNPFLKIVDRQHLDDILEQQNISLSGLISDADVLEVGNLTGAEALLIGQVMDYREEEGDLQQEIKRGYESYTVKEKGEDGKEVERTRYRPVKYYEFRKRNKVYLSFNVKLLHLETSEVLFSEVVEREMNDDVHWVTYKGNASRLFPEREDKPYLRRSAVNELRSLTSARKEPTSIGELTDRTFGKVGDAIAYKVDDYLQ